MLRELASADRQLSRAVHDRRAYLFRKVRKVVERQIEPTVRLGESPATPLSLTDATGAVLVRVANQCNTAHQKHRVAVQAAVAQHAGLSTTTTRSMDGGSCRTMRDMRSMDGLPQPVQSGHYSLMVDGEVESSDVVIDSIIIDCSDPTRLASFWAQVLGRRVAGTDGPYVWLSYLPDTVGIGFQRVADPKVGKNRVHFDLRVNDVAAAKSAIEALGGRRVEGYERGGFLVMADPEGNEFCLLPVAPFSLDDEGRADYLDHLAL